MTTPPGGPYGNEYPAQPPHGGGRAGRFNFPSAPSGSRRRPGQEQPQAPQAPGIHQDTPDDRPPQRHTRPEPAGQERSGPGAAPGGHGGGGGARDWSPAAARQTPSSGRRHMDIEPQQPLVRPYAMTGGRTRPRYQLAIEGLSRFTSRVMRVIRVASQM